MSRPNYRDQARVGKKIKTGGVGMILGAMFRTIQSELGINMTKFNELMVRYLSDKKRQLPMNAFEQSSARGNLRKELLRESMTWKVFCKGLNFFNVKKFKMEITLYHANGKVTRHEQMVNMGEVNLEEEPLLKESVDDKDFN